MQLNITARHIDLTPALSDFVHRKVEKAQKYFDAIIWAQAILSVEKHRHIAELVVHTPGNTFRTLGEAGDLYSAIDLATHKLELHLSRVKDKKSKHRVKAKRRIGEDRKPMPDDLESSAGFSPEDPILKKITEFTKTAVKPFSIHEAIEELERTSRNYFLFLNEQTRQIVLIYKKGKKGYGLVEAES
jgi:putative sigma-54 modulation protein